MERRLLILLMLTGAELASSLASAQTIDLNTPAGRHLMTGTGAGARAGSWLHMGDLTGDFWRKELIVGSPDEDSGRGTVRIRFGTSNRRGDFTTAEADAVVTGGAAGDRFGAAADAGHVTRHEVVIVDGRPVNPTPRDLVVGAPNARGGRGEVYLFPGPFTHLGNRTTADAAYTIVGRANGRLGTLVETADLNGDSYREIIAAEPGTGCVHVIDVHNATGSTLDLAARPAAMTICGLSGAPAIATGDITGDGIFDLAIASPAAAGGRGQVYVIRGRTGALPATRSMPANADAVFTGGDLGDAAGTALWIADIDDDGDPTAELITGSPGADGSGNARPDAGEVHVFWGSASLPAVLAPNLTLIGAATGHRLGEKLTAGDLTNDGPEDIVALARGANSGIGEVYVYLGRHRYAFPASRVADFAAGADRRVIGDRAAGPIESLRVWEASGIIEDIAIGVPSAATAGGAAAGRVYFALSPQVDLSNTSFTTTVAQCASPSIEVQVTNPSVIGVPWTFYTETPWLRASTGAGGTAVEGAAPAPFRLVATTRGLAPGTYSGNATILSRSGNLVMGAVVWVNVTVTSAAPTARSAAFDMTGDGCGDPVLFRPSTGSWIVESSPSGSALGRARDIAVPGDYDGDLRAEAAVFRPSTGDWLFAASTIRHGAPGDWPVPADYDGDGLTDLAVFNPSTAVWSIRGQSAIQWGQRGDVPVPADYNGDGRAELAVYRRASGTWLIRGGATVQWGGGYEMPVPADYDGDGRDDVAVYNRTRGTWRVMDQLTTQIGSDGDLPVPFDYDRDGRADLAIFQRASGRWIIHGTVTQLSTSIQGGAFDDVPALVRPYLIFGEPTDFTSDGWTDLVWQHEDGRIAVWRMNGTNLVGGIVLADRVSDFSWHIVGTGDFNGDRRPDLLWQHDDGRVVIWLMDGTRLLEGRLVTRASDLGWRIGGTGDLDGDGQVDIVWQHPDGRVLAWLMNGTTLVRGVLIAQVSDPNWTLSGTADVNGDGSLDLLWHHRIAGHVVTWIMNGTVLVRGLRSPDTVSDPNWRIVGAADMNGDGQPDIIWQHRNGYAVTWLMDGERILRGAALMPSMPSDNRWQLTGPR